ncbi:MAG: Na(+)-translocating NADH-quinone reductase subunit C [Rhodobacterales bacterium]|nr:MAG: Na(+)-translocating NADH-quinone reductase subunit C [Rhodobacterales bacterium]
MSDTTEAPKGPIGRFLAASPDGVGKTITVAVTLCLFASMIVSVAAVSLRPVQEANKLRDKQLNILQVAGQYEPGIDITAAFEAFEGHVLDIRTGELTDEFDPATFDDLAAADDPALSRALSDDPASIGRQSYYRTIYFLRDENGALDKVILPVHGYGLWSTLYGYMAIEEDGNDIFGLQFYSQAETPGLGAEVDNPRWKALWLGKKLRDENGVMQINVGKKATAAGADYHVDALAGATLTSRGVDNLVKFWMGEEGYALFLSKLQAGEF